MVQTDGQMLLLGALQLPAFGAASIPEFQRKKKGVHRIPVDLAWETDQIAFDRGRQNFSRSLLVGLCSKQKQKQSGGRAAAAASSAVNFLPFRSSKQRSAGPQVICPLTECQKGDRGALALYGSKFGNCCRSCGHGQGTLMLCDDCDSAYHLDCLPVPLTRVPSGDWRCPCCDAGIESREGLARLQTLHSAIHHTTKPVSHFTVTY